MKSVHIGQLLDRGRRDAGTPPDGFEALVRRLAAGRNDHGAVHIGQAASRPYGLAGVGAQARTYRSHALTGIRAGSPYPA